MITPIAAAGTPAWSSDSTWRADLEAPFVYWVPSIAVYGLTFYTGNRFPAWKGNVFVGAMFQGS